MQCLIVLVTSVSNGCYDSSDSFFDRKRFICDQNYHAQSLSEIMKCNINKLFIHLLQFVSVTSKFLKSSSSLSAQSTVIPLID